MEIRDMFVKSLLVGIYERSEDVSEDLFFTALMNKIDIETTDKVSTAAATLQDLKSKIIVNIESLSEKFGYLDRQNMILLYRAIVKHELMHIYLGHLLLPDIIKIDTQQLMNKLKRKIDLPKEIEIDTRNEEFRIVFNIAADAIINDMINEFKKLEEKSVINLAKAEDFFSNKIPLDKPTFCCGTKLLENCSAEELAAILWYMLTGNSQSASSQDATSEQSVFGQNNSGVQDVPKENNQEQTQKYKGKGIPQDAIGKDINYVPDNVKDIAEEMWKDLIEKVSEVSNRGLDKIGAELKKKLEKKGKINWKQQLKAEIWGEISEDISVSKHRLSKRTCLPPKIVKRPVPTVLAFVDTSGSISDEQLDRFLKELGKLKVDTNAQMKAVMYSTSATVNKIKKRNDIVLIGERGGTDLRSVMKQLSPKEFAFIDSLVVFTDGYDEFPSEEMAKIQAKKIFVLPRQHNETFKEQAKKIGKVIIMED